MWLSPTTRLRFSLSKFCFVLSRVCVAGTLNYPHLFISHQLAVHFPPSTTTTTLLLLHHLTLNSLWRILPPPVGNTRPPVHSRSDRDTSISVCGENEKEFIRFSGWLRTPSLFRAVWSSSSSSRWAKNEKKLVCAALPPSPTPSSLPGSNQQFDYRWWDGSRWLCVKPSAKRAQTASYSHNKPPRRIARTARNDWLACHGPMAGSCSLADGLACSNAIGLFFFFIPPYTTLFLSLSLSDSLRFILTFSIKIDKYFYMFCF